MIKRPSVVTLTLLILIVTSLIIFNKINSNTINIPLINKKPIEYMYKLIVYNYDEHGILKNFIKANSWRFVPKKQYSTVHYPDITIYKTDKLIYNITANLANVVQKNLYNDQIDHIKFFDNVIVNKQHINKHNSEFNLVTSYLEFNPNTEHAYTNKQVTINKTGLIITGTGMTADLKNNQLDLHKNVFTTYHE